MPDHKTLDQKRAQHAYEIAKKVADSNDDGKKKKFKTQVKRLPARIMTSGLGPALAFLMAKQYTPELRQALSEWVSHQNFKWAPAPSPRDNGRDRLATDILANSSDFLRLATAESLAYLQWLGRFTDALLKDVKTDGEN